MATKHYFHFIFYAIIIRSQGVNIKSGEMQYLRHGGGFPFGKTEFSIDQIRIIDIDKKWNLQSTFGTEGVNIGQIHHSKISLLGYINLILLLIL